MEYEIKPKQKFSLNFKELTNYSELLYFFTWRDIKIKYKQTVLGALWAVLQPLFMMLIFTFFFSKILNQATSNIPYPIFVFTGLIFWNIFSNGLINAGNSMINNANIIKKIYFPRLLIPLSSIASTLVDFFIAYLIYISLLIFYGFAGKILILTLIMPVSIIITLLFTFGLGCWLAALNIKYRDFRYVIPFMVQSLMFLTPIIYPVSIINIAWVEAILKVNPMAVSIQLMRTTLTGQPIDFISTSIGFLIAIGFFIIGLAYFRKTEYYFADLA